MSELPEAATATRVSACRLAAVDEPWPFANAHRAAIEAHWQRALSERPKLFNGTIYLMRDYALAGDVMSATLFRTDFKDFLYWREHERDDTTLDAFGASVIRSAEGHVLLGVQSAGHLNAGLAYPPSGMIDADDERDGTIDIEASIVRELREETGLEPATLDRVPGFVLVRQGPFVAIAIEWQSREPASELRRRILAHNEAQQEPELADIVIVREVADLDRYPMQSHVPPLLRFLLSA